jgi:hypothetical protein
MPLRTYIPQVDKTTDNGGQKRKEKPGWKAKSR